ncbi:MAG TPA: hypothetical protein PLI57_03865 [Spirochaetota bacterium]|nr:hypothetical protein [Spirochaetota bacterium]
MGNTNNCCICVDFLICPICVNFILNIICVNFSTTIVARLPVSYVSNFHQEATAASIAPYALFSPPKKPTRRFSVFIFSALISKMFCAL